VARAGEAPPGEAAPAGGAEPAAGAGANAKALIVPDDAAAVEPHQLKRAQALAQLRATATAAAESALAGSGWAPLVRPNVVEQLEATFARYAALDAAGLEQALREGAAGATAASALLEPVAEQVKEAVEEGLPDDAPPSAEDLAGGVIGAVKGLLFKKRGGASAATGDPLAVRRRLGRGQPLSGPVAARMGEALGDGFSDVQVHTDVGAGRIAGGFDARAFTVGSHIAFAPGEFRPGTLEGDALIAHELAHVAQQRGAPGVAREAAGEQALEADADVAAYGMVAALHDGERGRPSLARLRSGLRLQRCGYKTKKPDKVPESGKTVTGTMNTANTSGGLFYWPDYRKRSLEGQAGFVWDEKFRTGFATTTLLEKTGSFTWRLTGPSASAALGAWLAGRTVADCASVAVASYYQAILARIGAERFDKYFAPDGKNALVIGQYPDKVPLQKFLKHVERGRDEPLKEGDLYFFANHDRYKHKHPAGLWQGENAVYMGNDEWKGFGATEKRSDMEDSLVREYNYPRGRDDTAMLAGDTMPDGTKRNPDGSLPHQYRFPAEPGADGPGTLPVEITKPQLLGNGGGLQGSGWRVGDKQIDDEFPE
jgi:hypothetical protein